MKFYRSIAALTQDKSPKIAVIGNFDGLHMGHQRLLDRAQELAKIRGCKTVAITFYPHTKNSSNIFGLREKLTEFAAIGIDYCLALRFNAKLKNTTPTEFIKNLKDHANIIGLVIGEDFAFGKNRAGDADFLRDYALDIVKRDSISSSTIKKTLLQNDFEKAEELLGHKFYRIGRVISGNQMGRRIGFNTANVRLFDNKPFLSGVFAVNVIVDNKIYPAIANWGIRPTFNGNKPRLEVHIFDFDQNIYGKLIKVEFIKKIRDEKKFADVDELKNQIKQDIVEVRKIFGV
jgi:riboflavin kinase/FMN adenylyltransferase